VKQSLIAALFGVLIAQSAQAAWPERPIKLVVPFPPGGGTDAVARTVANRLSTELGQSIVIENRAGAGGTIGTDAVARSEPDGYTIGLATSSTHPAAVVLRTDLTYDPIKDFAPITQIGSTAFVIVASPELPAANLSEFIAYAKKQPEKLNFANVGVSTLGYLLSLQLQELTGLEFTHVQYKGSSQVYPDLMAGRVALLLDNPGASTSLVNAGKLRSYGVTIATPQLPEVPLISKAGADAGLGGYNTPFWYGLVAPAGTPQEVIDKVQQAVARYVATDEGKADFAKLSLQPVASTPTAFAARIKGDVEDFKALAQKVDLQAGGK
jgi:tripartite-type tricarboxylate transporter receptor subunit TctC